MLSMKRILCCTDFSPPSLAAFEAGCTLAREGRATVTLLHVVDAPLFVPSGVMTAPPPPPPEDEKRAAWDKLKAMKPTVPSVKLEYRVELGDIAPAILAVAKEIAADLIVIGTHGRTGVRRLLMGSVAENIVRNAPCPVLTLKTPS